MSHCFLILLVRCLFSIHHILHDDRDRAKHAGRLFYIVHLVNTNSREELMQRSAEKVNLMCIICIFFIFFRYNFYDTLVAEFLDKVYDNKDSWRS